jgi:predicted dehydrogenase
MLGYDHSFANAAADLVNCIAEGKNPSPCFKAGAQCVAVLEAVDKSAASGKWEKVEMIE